MDDLKMSHEEFVEKYGDMKVKFNSYYNYQFEFKGNGIRFFVGVCSDDFYKLGISADEEYCIKDLSPYCAYIGDTRIDIGMKE